MATTLVLEGASFPWNGKFRYYLIEEGSGQLYFREGESTLFESTPTWFDLAYKAIAAAESMGFEVVAPDNYLDAEEDDDDDDDAVLEVATISAPPPLPLPMSVLERPSSSITITLVEVVELIFGRDETLGFSTERYFVRGSSKLAKIAKATSFTTASDLITAALAMGFLIDDPQGLLDKELEEENS